MTTGLIDHVDARFGGKQLRFRLDRNAFPSLEKTLNNSAYQTFTRFAGGFWTFADLVVVLSASVPEEAGDFGMAAGHQVRSARKPSPNMPLELAYTHPESRFVRETVIRRPTGKYAVLALKVLEAALFGIAPIAATFDEDADIIPTPEPGEGPDAVASFASASAAELGRHADDGGRVPERA